MMSLTSCHRCCLLGVDSQHQRTYVSMRGSQASTFNLHLHHPKKLWRRNRAAWLVLMSTSVLLGWVNPESQAAQESSSRRVAAHDRTTDALFAVDARSLPARCRRWRRTWIPERTSCCTAAQGSCTPCCTLAGTLETAPYLTASSSTLRSRSSKLVSSPAQRSSAGGAAACTLARALRDGHSRETCPMH